MQKHLDIHFECSIDRLTNYTLIISLGRMEKKHVVLTQLQKNDALFIKLNTFLSTKAKHYSIAKDSISSFTY